MPSSHSVREAGTLVRVVHRSEVSPSKGAHVPEGSTSEGAWVGRCQTGSMTRRILKNVAVDGLSLQSVQLGSERILAKALLGLGHRVQGGLRVIDVVHVVRKVLVDVTSSTLGVSDTFIKCHVVERVVTMEGVSILLLTLKLVLNAFAVRCVADEWKNRPDAFDEERALAGVGIVESGLPRHKDKR